MFLRHILGIVGVGLDTLLKHAGTKRGLARNGPETVPTPAFA